MTALLVLGIILLFFVFLLSLRATVTVCYGEELSLFVKVLFLRIKILPKKEKKGSGSLSAKKAKKIRDKLALKKKKKAVAAKEKKLAKEEKKKHKKKKSIGEILDLLRLITALLGVVIRKFSKHIRIHLSRLKLTVATADAATTAVAYGAATQTLSVLFPLLESVKQIRLPKENELDVGIDFLSDTPSFDLKLSVSLRVWHVFDVAFGALFTFIGHKIKTAGSHPTPDHKGFPSH
jgi:hypothetical protein